jgi:hypothetical protein
MRKKLRRGKPRRKVCPIMVEAFVDAGLKAENEALKWLLKNFGDKHVVDMRYPSMTKKENDEEITISLTDVNNLIVDALEGIDRIEGIAFHNYQGEYGNPEKPEYWDGYVREVLKKCPNRGDVLHIHILLKNLEDMAKAKKDTEALDLIGELQERFKKLDASDFLTLLGLLKGTKMDFIAVENGIFIDAKDWDSIVKMSEKGASAKELMSKMDRMIKASARVIFYDAKNREHPDKDQVIKWRLLKHYLGFSEAGIPYYLLMWNDELRKLYYCDIGELRRVKKKDGTPLIPDDYGNYRDDAKFYIPKELIRSDA